MKIEEIVQKEIKRLNRLNDKLEESTGDEEGTSLNLGIYKQIQENALAINEIAKANGLLTDKMLQQINKYLGEKY